VQKEWGGGWEFSAFNTTSESLKMKNREKVTGYNIAISSSDVLNHAKGQLEYADR
jgi:hypothetical protein